MKPHVRAAVAAIAISHANNRNVSSVYDYSQGRYLNIEAAVSGNHVNGYDYSNGCHVDGTMPSLYHYGERCHIDLNHSGAKYEGYDYGSGSHFEVTVNGSNAEVYDYGAGRYFSFST